MIFEIRLLVDPGPARGIPPASCPTGSATELAIGSALGSVRSDVAADAVSRQMRTTRPPPRDRPGSARGAAGRRSPARGSRRLSSAKAGSASSPVGLVHQGDVGPERLAVLRREPAGERPGEAGPDRGQAGGIDGRHHFPRPPLHAREASGTVRTTGRRSAGSGRSPRPRRRAGGGTGTGAPGRGSGRAGRSGSGAGRAGRRSAGRSRG